MSCEFSRHITILPNYGLNAVNFTFSLKGQSKLRIHNSHAMWKMYLNGSGRRIRTIYMFYRHLLAEHAIWSV